jgi:hypothetical protein
MNTENQTPLWRQIMRDWPKGGENGTVTIPGDSDTENASAHK